MLGTNGHPSRPDWFSSYSDGRALDQQGLISDKILSSVDVVSPDEKVIQWNVSWSDDILNSWLWSEIIHVQIQVCIVLACYISDLIIKFAKYCCLQPDDSSFCGITICKL